MLQYRCHIILYSEVPSENTTVICEILMQAPIQVFGIEGRYAHALFSAASKQNAIEKVEKELADFQVRHNLWTVGVLQM